MLFPAAVAHERVSVTNPELWQKLLDHLSCVRSEIRSTAAFWDSDSAARRLLLEPPSILREVLARVGVSVSVESFEDCDAISLKFGFELASFARQEAGFFRGIVQRHLRSDSVEPVERRVLDSGGRWLAFGLGVHAETWLASLEALLLPAMFEGFRNTCSAAGDEGRTSAANHLIDAVSRWHRRELKRRSIQGHGGENG